MSRYLFTCLGICSLAVSNNFPCLQYLGNLLDCCSIDHKLPLIIQARISMYCLKLYCLKLFLLLHVHPMEHDRLLSANELYWLSNRRWSTNLMPNFADRGFVSWSARLVPTAVNLGFVDRSRYFFYSSSSSFILTGLSGPRSKSTASKKIC
jgi:hypothetical protein